MHKGNSGMGMHKHGVSGKPGKSPRFKHWLKREVEKGAIKRRGAIRNPKSSVKELFHDR